MSRKMEVVLIDDLEKKRNPDAPDVEADTTIPFSLDGTDYEIDLTSDNAVVLYDLLRPYYEAARRVTRPRLPVPGSRGMTGKKPGRDRTGNSSVIRAWAREQGIEISDRGRIPVDVEARYRAAAR